MPGFNFLRRFTGNTVSSAAGFGVGAAMSPALSPLTQELANDTWAAHPSRPLPASEVAAGAVRDLYDGGEAFAEAKRTGFNDARFARLLKLAENFPGLPDLLDLWRRDRIGRADVITALKRQGYSAWWADKLATLTEYLAPPSDLIRMAVREAFNPAQRDFLDLDAEFPNAFATRAEKLGLSREVAGDYWAAHWELPSYGQAAQMLFRTDLGRQGFRDLLKALDYAPTWRDKLEEIARAIPTVTDFQRLVRRGVYGGDERAMFQYDAEYPAVFTEKMALHGMNEKDARDLWAGGWRVPSATQLYHMLWRDEIDERGLALGLKALDYSPFWRDKLANIARPVPGRIDLRRMFAAGIRTRAETIAGYQRLGYTLADARDLVALADVGGATTARGLTAADLAAEYAERLLTRAQYIAELGELGYDAAAAEAKADVADAKRAGALRRQVIATARQRYITWKVDQAEAEQALRALDMTDAQVSELIASWVLERELHEHELTEAQIVRAFRKGFMDRNTAYERLIDLGLAPADVGIRLDE